MQTSLSPIDYENMNEMLKSARSDRELFDLIVNAPFLQYNVQITFLFLGIIVLLLVNKETGMIDRVALSNTDIARKTTEVSVVPFKEIKIDLKEKDNIIAQSIRTGQMRFTTDWKSLFVPSLNASQARINQASAGISYSAVYPIDAREGGALIFSYYQYVDMIGEAQEDFMEKYSKFVENSLNELCDRGSTSKEYIFNNGLAGLA